MSDFIHKLFTSYKERTDGDTRIGELYRIWYDSITNTLRIQLDNTPGGTVIGGGGSGGDYTLPTASTTVKGGVKIDGTTITINNQVISGFSGSYADLTNKPTIPSAQVNSDWTASSGVAQILNKPTLFDGAYDSLTGKPTLFSGSYTDLTNKPTIPDAYTLPTATDSILGGVKIGSNISINAGVISVAAPFSGSYADLTNKPTIPAAQIQSDWNQTTDTALDYIKNKPAVLTTEADTLDTVTDRGNTTTNDITVGDITTDKVIVNTSAGATVTTGQIAWNTADLTFDMGMANGVTLQVGQEQYIKVKAYEAISDGQAVMFAGADGEHILARKYNPTINGFIPEWFIGIATQDLAHNAFGYITVFGKVHNINTLAYALGDILYADNATPGALTNVAPVDPNPQIVVAAVTKRAGGDGHILVRPSFRNSINSLTDVTTTSPASGEFLKYDGSKWINSSVDYTTLTNKPTLFSGSYTDLTNKPTIPTTVTVNGTAITLGSSGTVTSAAGTLTGSTLASGVTTSSLTSVGTLTGLTVNSSSSTAVSITADGRPGSETNNWSFVSNQSIGGPRAWIQFPDSTLQTTAYTGTAPAGTLTGTTLNSTVVTSSLTSVGTLTSLTSSGLVRFNSDGVGASYNAVSNSVNIGGVLGVASNIYTNGNIDIVAGSAYYIGGNNVLNGTTLGSNIVNSSLTSVGTLTGLTSTGSVTANHTTAFIAGDNAISNVALQIPREGAIRNLYNGSGNNMYFDVSIGGASNGQFQFRSSSSFTNVLTMSPTAFNVNTDAVVTAKTASFGRTAWNSAIDTELTIDEYRFRINTTTGNTYAQIISNVTGQTKNSAWTAVAAISGQAVGQGGSTGTLVPNNAWTSLYTFASMNSAGDTVTVTLQDKALGRIYRVTFMRSDNGSTAGYNIIAERLL